MWKITNLSQLGQFGMYTILVTFEAPLLLIIIILLACWNTKLAAAFSSFFLSTIYIYTN